MTFFLFVWSLNGWTHHVCVFRGEFRGRGYCPPLPLQIIFLGTNSPRWLRKKRRDNFWKKGEIVPNLTNFPNLGDFYNLFRLPPPFPNQISVYAAPVCFCLCVSRSTKTVLVFRPLFAHKTALNCTNCKKMSFDAKMWTLSNLKIFLCLQTGGRTDGHGGPF